MSRQRPLPVLHPLSPHLMVFEVAIIGYLDIEWFGPPLELEGLAASLVGAFGIAYMVWCWRGRSIKARSWAYLQYGPEGALLYLPFFACGVFAVGVDALFDGPKVVALFPWLGCGFFALLAVFGLGDVPKWWGPRWFRRGEHRKKAKSKDVPHDPLGDVFAAYSNKPAVLSADQAEQDFGNGAKPMVSWKGGWVHDPDTQECENALTRKGTVEGSLLFYPHGLVFAASRQQDGLRGEQTVLPIFSEQITSIEVVSARAGADGRQRQGFFYRSPFPRLVVHTASGPYVFEIGWGRAKQAAEFLTKQVDQSS